MIKESRKIENVDDFNDYASEMWTAFLETFTVENGLIRPITENDDFVDPEWEFIYTNRGMKLAEDMKGRLVDVGNKHFQDEDIQIESTYYQEY